MSDGIDEILGMLEGDDPVDGVKRAKQRLKNGDLTSDQKNDLIYGIAVGLFHQEKFESSLKWLEKSNDSRRKLLTGFCHMELEQFSKAEKALQEAGELQPEHRIETQIMRGQALYFCEEYDQARQLFDEVLDGSISDEKEAETLLSLGMLESAEDNLSLARDHFKRIVDELSDTGFYLEGMYYLVEAYEQSGNVDKAIEYAELLSEDGTNTPWEPMAGELLQRLRQLESNRKQQLRDYEF